MASVLALHKVCSMSITWKHKKKIILNWASHGTTTDWIVLQLRRKQKEISRSNFLFNVYHAFSVIKSLLFHAANHSPYPDPMTILNKNIEKCLLPLRVVLPQPLCSGSQRKTRLIVPGSSALSWFAFKERLLRFAFENTWSRMRCFQSSNKTT